MTGETRIEKAWLVLAAMGVGGALPMLHPSYNSAPSTVAVFRASPVYEQAAAAFSVLAVKPAYMLLSLLLIIVLWRLKSPDVSALRHGLISFLAGETFCALNIVLFRDSFQPFEFLHMYGMVAAFVFLTYAGMEAVESRILVSGARVRCALLGVCRRCAGVGGECRARRMFYFLAPAGIVLAFIPLAASTRALSYYTSILGVSFNYAHPLAYQVFEIRYAPAYAMILLATSFLLLLLRRRPTAVFRVLFAAGSGCLGFSLLRLFFFSVGGDSLVWPNFWEEVTELMFVAGIGFALWTFRGSLFREREQSVSAGASE